MINVYCCIIAYMEVHTDTIMYTYYGMLTPCIADLYMQSVSVSLPLP